MSLPRSTTAITRTARSVEVSQGVQRQTRQAIVQSLKLLQRRVYPDDRAPRAEQ